MIKPLRPTLLPGTSADVEVILSVKDEVLRIPPSTLFEGKQVLCGGARCPLNADGGYRHEELGFCRDPRRAFRRRFYRYVFGSRRIGRGSSGCCPFLPWQAVIELQHISKSYEVGGQPIYALRDTSENIQSGEYVAIVGPSGSGKSTLLNIIGCLLRPSEGAYLFNGQDVSQLDDQALSHVRQHQIGFIFQSFHLVPRLTAEGNVALPMVFAGIPSSERQLRAKEALGSQ